MPETNVYSADESQLYAYLSHNTCRIDVTEHYVRLVVDYNTHDCPCACVFHGPSRGVTLYTPRSQVAPGHKGNASRCNPASWAADANPEAGAPVSDKFGAVKGARDLLLEDQRTHNSQLADCVERGLRARFDELALEYPQVNGIAPCVHIGGHPVDSTKFINVSACDAFYESIPVLAYAHCYPGFTSVRCVTVTAVYASPLANNQLYGCIPLDMSAILTHATDDEYVVLGNTPTWREQLIAISPGRAPFCFMNQETAQLCPETGEILRYRIKRADLTLHAKTVE